MICQRLNEISLTKHLIEASTPLSLSTPYSEEDGVTEQKPKGRVVDNRIPVILGSSPLYYTLSNAVLLA